MTIAETQTPRANGHAGMFAKLPLPTRERLDQFARSPKVTLPLGKKKVELATDRVRAAPAITPTLSGMIGMTAIGLGLAGLLFPKAVKRGLGVAAPTPVVQSIFGLRELWSGYSLVGDPTRTDVLWARVAGDVFDVATLKALDRPSNPKRGNVRLALGAVLAISALDLVTAVRMSTVKRTCD